MLQVVATTFSRGIEIVFLIILVIFYLKQVELKRAWWSFLSGSLLAFVIGFTTSFTPLSKSFETKFWITKGYLFITGSFLLLASLALFRFGRRSSEESERFFFEKESLLQCTIFIWGFVLFILEGAEVSSLLKDMAFIKESSLPYLFGGIGFILAGMAAAGLHRLARIIKLDRFLSFPSLLFSIVIIKVLWKPDLLLSLEVIVARILHDTVHWFIVLLLVPDHPYVKVSFWNLVSILFRKNAGLLINLAALFALGLFIIIILTTAPLPELMGVRKGSERRKIWAKIKRKRRLRALPVLISLLLLSWVGYGAYGSEKTLLEPTPQPISDEGKSYADIPLSEVSDGMMHKYVYVFKGKTIRFVIIKKPDGNFAVTLDCCRICPPKGYAQLDRDLFCIYCGTPIPVDTVGKPGGCNPVPIKFEIVNSKLRFPTRESISLWEEVNRGK